MGNKEHIKECKCTFCGNEDFEVPSEIINAIKKEELVVFAGAGVSTEGKNVYKTTLYTDVNDELGENYDNTFPQLMTKFCSKPNGRRILINRIIERFEYYKSFSEIDNIMKQFFCPLADIYSIKEIITTNWDRQFEEKCNCMPVVYNGDIPLLDDNKRKVYKIHGSIDNIGTLIITEEDYERCYNELRENLIGGKVKELLSRKTVVFIGYSLEDEDFRKIWQFIDDKLGELKPHFYVVTPDVRMKEKLKDKNVTVINTLGSNFIKAIRRQLIEDKYMLNPEILYNVVDSMLSLVLRVHRDTNDMMHEAKNSLLVYTLAFQDGIIHSLKRILSRESSGEYLNPDFLFNSIRTYYKFFNDYNRTGDFFNSAYLIGYALAMDCVCYLYDCISNDKKPEEDKMISLYYLPKGKIYNDLGEFELDLEKYKIKKYINFADELIKNLGNENFEFEVHHPPFI
ncbi:MAG: SIR2 family protein [Bacilli bacterium]|nr:SIR2 family protein [Bacilli bacterium]